jgi:hypothetical protein
MRCRRDGGSSLPNNRARLATASASSIALKIGRGNSDRMRCAALFSQQIVQLIGVASRALEFGQNRIAGSWRTGHPGEHLQKRWRRLFLVLFSAGLRLLHRGDEILDGLLDSSAVPTLLPSRRRVCSRDIGAAERPGGNRAHGRLLPPGAICEP